MLRRGFFFGGAISDSALSVRRTVSGEALRKKRASKDGKSA